MVKSGFFMYQFGIELGCPSCGRYFVICRKCYRGDIYCSDECRIKIQDQKRKEASRKYAQSTKGRKSHKARQRRYRLQFRVKGLIQKKIETHKTSNKRRCRIKIPHAKEQVCAICQTLVEYLFRNHNEIKLAVRRL